MITAGSPAAGISVDDKVTNKNVDSVEILTNPIKPVASETDTKPSESAKAEFGTLTGIAALSDKTNFDIEEIKESNGQVGIINTYKKGTKELVSKENFDYNDGKLYLNYKETYKNGKRSGFHITKYDDK